MTNPLQGTELRVFHSLLQEWDRDRAEDIRVQLTRGPHVSGEEVEQTLFTLSERGYVHEKSPGRWGVAPSGYGLKRTLLRELPRVS